MKLKELATIKVGYKSANFWITRRGSIQTVGKPTRIYNPEYIGIQVVQTHILNSDFLYYVMLNLFNQNYWATRYHGTLNLVHIRTSEVKNLEFET